MTAATAHPTTTASEEDLVTDLYPDTLRGPWFAVLSDRGGDCYDTVADAILNLGEEEEIEIAVVRGSAAPKDDHRPGSYSSGDVAYEIECYLIDPDDESIGAEARLAQAKAMAAGLNAAGGHEPRPGYPCVNPNCGCRMAVTV